MHARATRYAELVTRSPIPETRKRTDVRAQPPVWLGAEPLRLGRCVQDAGDSRREAVVCAWIPVSVVHRECRVLREVRQARRRRVRTLTAGVGDDGSLLCVRP